MGRDDDTPRPGEYHVKRKPPPFPADTAEFNRLMWQAAWETHAAAFEASGRVSNLEVQMAGLPCRPGKDGIVPACPLPPSPYRSAATPSDPANPTVKKSDLDQTGKHILEEAREEAREEAERTFDQRLRSLEREREEVDRRREEAVRQRWDWRVGLVSKLVPVAIALAGGIGAGWAFRCNAAPGAQQQQTHYRHAPHGDAARR